MSILYIDVKVPYSAKSAEGKICRRLLKMYQNFCRNDHPEFDEEDLPAVTDASDDETLPVTNKKKRFKSCLRRRLDVQVI